MEAVALHRVAILVYFCPEQGQDVKLSAARRHPYTQTDRQTDRHVYLESYTKIVRRVQFPNK